MDSTLHIVISLAEQRLRLYTGDHVSRDYAVSTAKNGSGEINGSGCTPRGRHRIRAKIGAGCPVNTVFVERRPTGEIFVPTWRARYPERDWILTRILWLGGVERGVNRMGNVDTLRRFIYIHGTPDDVPMGILGSKGCVRMRNADLIELFDAVGVGTPVLIQETPFSDLLPLLSK